jgi:hypothetical protein
MRSVAATAIVIAAMSAGGGAAQAFDLGQWCRQADAWVGAWVHGLIEPRTADDEIIRPPRNIDPRMALAPPQSGGTLRIIPPPGSPGR